MSQHDELDGEAIREMRWEVGEAVMREMIEGRMRKRKQPLDNAYMDAQIRAGENLKGEDLEKCLVALAVWMKNHEEEE